MSFWDSACDDCSNKRYDNMLERNVCDQRYPEPEGCPRVEEWERQRERKERGHRHE